MNVIKTLLLITVFTLSFSTVNAQSKVAHINLEELVSSMPAFKALQSKLEKIGKTYRDEITTSETELQAKFQRYNLEAEKQTPATNEARKNEVQMASQKLEKYRNAAAEDMQSLEQEGLKPIYDAAMKAIDEVAAAQGYEYVLNANVLIIAKGKNLLPDVKAKLGI